MPVPKFLRNVEVVKTVGGNPFIVKTEVPSVPRSLFYNY